MNFGGEGVVDFVVQQVAALLAHVDELANLIVFLFQSQSQGILRVSVELETLPRARAAGKPHAGTPQPVDTQIEIEQSTYEVTARLHFLRVCAPLPRHQGVLRSKR